MKIWRLWKHQIITLIAHINLFLFFSWEVIIAGLVASVFVSLFAHYLYIHRIFTHQHFQWSKNMNKFGQFVFCMLNLGAPSVYSAIHMKHHKYSDTDKDPHPPSWRALLSLWDDEFYPDIKTLKKNKSRDYFYETYLYISFLSLVFTPFLIVGGHWHSKLVTTLVHIGGKPGNIWWAYPIMLGEEMHERHHNNWLERRHHRLDILYQIGNFFNIGKVTKVS